MYSDLGQISKCIKDEITISHCYERELTTMGQGIWEFTLGLEAVFNKWMKIERRKEN